jgi:hypothetical protein
MCPSGVVRRHRLVLPRFGIRPSRVRTPRERMPYFMTVVPLARSLACSPRRLPHAARLVAKVDRVDRRRSCSSSDRDVRAETVPSTMCAPMQSVRRFASIRRARLSSGRRADRDGRNGFGRSRLQCPEALGRSTPPDQSPSTIRSAITICRYGVRTNGSHAYVAVLRKRDRRRSDAWLACGRASYA